MTPSADDVGPEDVRPEDTRPEDTSGVTGWVEEGGRPVPPTEASDEVHEGEVLEGEVVEAAPVDGTPAPGGAGDTESSDELTVTRIALEERTLDLQRLQAEYLNYKRRVERDRELIKQNATYAALAPIIDVLDNIERAREHGTLDDGFRAVAEQLERVVAGLGLVKFGAAGDAFDPTVHEALSHLGEDPEVSVTTCKVIAKAGYRIGERVVRAAQVLVVDPAAATA